MPRRPEKGGSVKDRPASAREVHLSFQDATEHRSRLSPERRHSRCSRPEGGVTSAGRFYETGARAEDRPRHQRGSDIGRRRSPPHRRERSPHREWSPPPQRRSDICRHSPPPRPFNSTNRPRTGSRDDTSRLSPPAGHDSQANRPRHSTRDSRHRSPPLQGKMSAERRRENRDEDHLSPLLRDDSTAEPHRHSRDSGRRSSSLRQGAHAAEHLRSNDNRSRQHPPPPSRGQSSKRRQISGGSSRRHASPSRRPQTEDALPDALGSRQTDSAASLPRGGREPGRLTSEFQLRKQQQMQTDPALPPPPPLVQQQLPTETAPLLPYDPALDFRSPEFDPFRALYAPAVELPNPRAMPKDYLGKP